MLHGNVVACYKWFHPQKSFCPTKEIIYFKKHMIISSCYFFFLSAVFKKTSVLRKPRRHRQSCRKYRKPITSDDPGLMKWYYLPQCVDKYWCYHLSHIQRIIFRSQFEENFHAIKSTISSCVFLKLSGLNVKNLQCAI